MIDDRCKILDTCDILDIDRAFDSMSHQNLLKKMYSYDIRGSVLR